MGGRNPLGRVARFAHPSPFFTAREKKTLTTPDRLTALMPVAGTRDTETYELIIADWNKDWTLLQTLSLWTM